LLQVLSERYNIPGKNLTDEYNAFIQGGINGLLDVTGVHTRFAEIITSKTNGKKLGLRPTDDISDVLEQGENFFLQRFIGEEAQLDSRVNKGSYDLVLRGRGRNLYVMVRGNHITTNAVTGERQLTGLEGWAEDKATFEDVSGNTYYDGDFICSTGTKKFYSKPGVRTNNHLVVIDDISELDELMQSDAFRRIEYNFTTDNTKSLLAYKFKYSVDESGNFTDNIDLSGRVANNIANASVGEHHFRGRAFTKGQSLAELNVTDDLVKALSADQLFSLRRTCMEQAKRKYAAFLKQLDCVGARIPTQSMQSFMGLHIVGFSESGVNEVYVPTVMTWLQGSDYDIDKLYMMGYELNDLGALPLNSALQNSLPDAFIESDIDNILLLDKANGKRYTRSNTDSADGLSKTEVVMAINLKDVSAFNKVMRSDSTVVTFAPDVDQEFRNTFMSMLNRHTSTRLSRMQKESVLKNSVVHRLINLLRHPKIQPLGHLPVVMDMFKQIAQKSTLSKAEQTMSLDNPLSKYIMQMQNMVGKDVIGITAVGLKVFFATSSAMNLLVSQIAQEIKSGASVGTIEKKLKDIQFVDPVTKYPTTIANLNLDPILDALEALPADQQST